MHADRSTRLHALCASCAAQENSSSDTRQGDALPEREGSVFDLSSSRDDLRLETAIWISVSSEAGEGRG